MEGQTQQGGLVPGETVIAGIGQGYWEVTPLQLAHAWPPSPDAACLTRRALVMATRTLAMRSHAAANPPSGPSLIKNSKDWDVINEGMRAVIYSGGTGNRRWRLNDGFPYRIAGKSGTAERFSRTSPTPITPTRTRRIWPRVTARGSRRITPRKIRRSPWPPCWKPVRGARRMPARSCARFRCVAGDAQGGAVPPCVRCPLPMPASVRSAGSTPQSVCLRRIPEDPRPMSGAGSSSAERHAMIDTLHPLHRFLRRILTRPRIDLPLAFALSAAGWAWSRCTAPATQPGAGRRPGGALRAGRCAAAADFAHSAIGIAQLDAVAVRRQHMLAGGGGGAG
jgi:hypothetical protein